MQIDFFVHPEHARDSVTDRARYEQYSTALKGALDRSQLPILIKGIEKRAFDMWFPMERRIESASYHVIDIPIDRGEVAPDYNWSKFIDLINILPSVNSYRVHGTFFGQCTEGFAVQLFGYIQNREHWHDWWATENEESAKREEVLRIQHMRAGNFGRSPIKYGIVLAPKRGVNVRKPSLINKLRGMPFGNITYQLMDDKTAIF